MSLGNAPSCRIAGHLGNEVNIEGIKSGFQAHASRGHSGLATGVSGTDVDYIELFRKTHGTHPQFVRTFILASRRLTDGGIILGTRAQNDSCRCDIQEPAVASRACPPYIGCAPKARAHDDAE